MKKDITKLVLGVSIIAGTMGFLSSDAITLSLNLNSAETSISTNEIVPIHFKEYKNDFGGFIYFQSDDVANSSTDTEEDDGDDGDEGFEVSDYEDFDAYEYQINGSSCKFQKRGFYYNAERGERLWPLDQATKEMRHLEDLSMSGGIFSNCSPDLAEYQEKLEACGESTSSEEGVTNTEDCVKEVEETYYDPYSYHGVVTHEYSGQKFALAVGVSYATGTPWIEMKTNLGKTFQYHPGVRHSFGFLYDYNGGVGFAGCEILGNDASELNNIIDSGVNDKGITEFFVKSGAIDETPYLIYTGGEGKFECKNIGQDMNSALMILVEGLIGMGNNTSYYKEMDQSVAQKSQYFASININNATMINYARQRAEILCRGKWQSATSTQEGINCINGSYTLTESDKNRTIIVRNGSVTVSPFFIGKTNGYYDIFIDSGNLIIDEPNPGDYDENDYKFVIKSNGFVDNSCDIECFTDKIADAKNGDPVNYDNLNDIGVASILKGNFIVNGHVKGGNSNNKLNNKYFIYGKLTSLDDNLSLKDTFKWGCLGDEGSDYPCPYSPQTGPNRHSYQNAPLVIIDQNYDSPLFK